MTVIGYCLCNEPVYRNEEEDRNVFTCHEFPCEMVVDQDGNDIEEVILKSQEP